MDFKSFMYIMKDLKKEEHDVLLHLSNGDVVRCSGSDLQDTNIIHDSVIHCNHQYINIDDVVSIDDYTLAKKELDESLEDLSKVFDLFRKK